MSAPNPYRPPESYVSDVAAPDAGADAYVDGGRGVPAGNGWKWIADGYGLFKRRIGEWILTTIVFFALLFGLNLIPMIGWLGTTVLFPVVTGGIMLGCRALERDNDFGVRYLFAGFQSRTGELIVIGALYLLAWMVLMIPVFLVIGGSMFSALFLGGDPAQLAQGVGASFLIAMLLMLGLSVPVYMAVWFAPALVVFHDKSPVQAMAASFRACLKNIWPFLVYGIVVTLLALVAVIPVGLGFLVLGPVLLASVYTAYRDIFFDA